MKTLRGKLLLTLGIVLAAGLAAIAMIAQSYIRDQLDGDLDSQLKTRAFAVSRILDARHPRLLPYMEQGLDLKPESYFAQLFDADGKPLDQSANMAHPLALSDQAKRIAPDRTEPVVEDAVDASGKPLRIATMARSDYLNGQREAPLFAQVGIPLGRHRAHLDQLTHSIAVTAGTIWIIGMIVAGLLMRHWFQDLALIQQTTSQITAATLSRQRVLVPPGDGEIAGLATSLNQLLDQLECVHLTQQRFIADASHELRTPLTILRGEIEVALRKPRSSDEYRDVLQSNKEEIESLARLTDNLLTLARADAGQALASRCEVDLSAVVREVSSRLLPTAEKQGVSIDVQLEECVMVAGDKLGLERVLFNLLDNAISYSPRDEKVSVSLRRDGGSATMEVRDTGPGIPPEHLPRLFERFYRADQSRSREQEGAGLGLAIVKTFVEAHGGNVSVTSEIGHGSVFTVTLPAMTD